MAMRKGGVIAAVGGCLLAASAGFAQGNAVGAPVESMAAPAALGGGDGTIVTGRKRPIYPNAPQRGDAIEIEPGRQLSGDFADAPPLSGRNRMMIYLVQGVAGKAITAKVDSPDVHPWLYFSRELTNVWTGPTAAPMPVAGGPKSNFVTLVPQRTGPYYVFVWGVPTKENGKLAISRQAESGRFTITVTDADHPEPAAAPTLATGPAAPASAAAALAQNYAQLCGTPAQAGSETCVALRKALAAQIAEAKKAPAAMIGGPLGVRVVEGSGAQVRAEIVALDPGGAAARAGLKVGDALLYAKGADGGRTFFGDQASVDTWAARQAAGSAHEFAYARKGEAAVRSALVRLAAPAGQ